MEIFNFEQRSADWYAARLGLPTASCFHKVLAKGEGKVRRSYMLELAGELLSGEQTDGYESADMVRGRELEEEARNLYALIRGEEPELVGFVKNHGAGCSPDSIIGTEGMLEIKTKKPALLVECMLRGDLPPEHRAQVQGGLWVTERQWCDLMVYWPTMKPFIVRAHRDDAYIAELAKAVTAFNDELQNMVASLRGADQFRNAA